MSDKNIVVLEKVLGEMGVARSFLQGYDLDSFMADEFPPIEEDIAAIIQRANDALV